MKSLYIMSLCLLCCWAKAQDINQAEYFIDTDPGAGNGTSIVVPTPGANVNLTANISVATLTNGFHFLGVRTRGNDGKWGLYELRGFVITQAANNAPNITAAEYFIDTDPGPGAGTPLSIGTAGTNVSFVANIPVSSLSPGFHFVCVRVQDDVNGRWGFFEVRGFLISTASATNAAAITAAEYFIDTDPGIGNGNAVSVGTSGNTVNFVANVPLGSLAEGFHFLSIRTKDVDGKWGFFETRGFYVSSSAANSASITAAEYFIDSDPGVGNGNTLAIGTSGNNVNFTANIALGSLAEGFHFLAIRTKDANGKWGLFETRGFLVTSAANNAGQVVNGEYFFDTDPGAGNGSAFSFATAGNNVSETFNFTVPLALSQGIHKLIVRTRNSDGKWGLFELSVDITVSGTLPLNLLSFEGRKENAAVRLKWTTQNEQNTARFAIERSADGINYQSIGSVAAQNRAGNHQYDWLDAQPLKGINLYRLRQFDLDGKFTLSKTVRIRMEDAANFLQVFPNPTTDRIYIDWNGKENVTIRLINANGAVIESKAVSMSNAFSINVSSLAKGVYWVELNDGTISKKASFIKQ
jgi:hypothetical protein